MSYRVFIIDEHEIDLIILRRTVIKSGLHQNPRLFRNGLQALEHLSLNPVINEPVLIFLDIYMPDFSGYDFLELLKTLKIDSQVHIIIVTSSVNNEDKKRMSEYENVISYVHKPFKLEDIQRAGNLFLEEISR